MRIIKFSLEITPKRSRTLSASKSKISNIANKISRSCAEDGTQIGPFTFGKLNYTTFFADREQTELLAFQLKQLKDYLELKGYASLR